MSVTTTTTTTASPLAANAKTVTETKTFTATGTADTTALAWKTVSGQVVIAAPTYVKISASSAMAAATSPVALWSPKGESKEHNPGWDKLNDCECPGRKK